MAKLSTTQLRLAVPADAPVLAAISRDHIESGLRWRWRTPAILKLIQRNHSTVLAAQVELSGRRLYTGFAAMDFCFENSEVDADRAVLSLLAVLPSARRCGLGARLVRWLEESAAVAGCQSIDLTVREDNRSARRFYERLDYQAVARIPGYYDGQEAAVQYHRELGLNLD